MPQAHSQGSPSDWLRYALSDLELATTANAVGVMLEMLCFHAQQAAEKALKAVLIGQGIPFPKTHNLRVLLDLLPERINVPEDVRASASLTDYAVSTRYPGVFEAVTEEEYQEAIRLAQSVVNWAKGLIQSIGAEDESSKELKEP